MLIVCCAHAQIPAFVSSVFAYRTVQYGSTILIAHYTRTVHHLYVTRTVFCLLLP